MCCEVRNVKGISIHALLAESDCIAWVVDCWPCNFYPRSPCGERRYLINTYHRIFGISIHALLAESDSCTSIGRPKRLYFYPRSPCGERPKSDTATAFPLSFLSTLSLRRATTEAQSEAVTTLISIHALLAESD